MSNVGEIGKGTLRGIHSMRTLALSEQRRVLEEMSKMRSLLPLLMRPRHQRQWSRAEKVLLARHIKRLSSLGPYLILLVLPGGCLALPAWAWWLARRRMRDTQTPQ